MPLSAFSKQRITGSAELRAALRAIPAEVRSQVLAEMVSQAAKPLRDDMRRRAPRKTGALQKSIATVVRQYPNTATAVAVTGPDGNYYKQGARLRKNADRSGADRPSKYAHLIEYGHNIVTGGSLRAQYHLALVETGKVSKNGNPMKRWKRAGVRTRAAGTVVGWVPPKPFVRPALMANQATIADQLEKHFEKGLERVIAKLTRAGTHKS